MCSINKTFNPRFHRKYFVSSDEHPDTWSSKAWSSFRSQQQNWRSKRRPFNRYHELSHPNSAKKSLNLFIYVRLHKSNEIGFNTDSTKTLYQREIQTKIFAKAQKQRRKKKYRNILSRKLVDSWILKEIPFSYVFSLMKASSVEQRTPYWIL